MVYPLKGKNRSDHAKCLTHHDYSKVASHYNDLSPSYAPPQVASDAYTLRVFLGCLIPEPLPRLCSQDPTSLESLSCSPPFFHIFPSLRDSLNPSSSSWSFQSPPSLLLSYLIILLPPFNFKVTPRITHDVSSSVLNCTMCSINVGCNEWTSYLQMEDSAEALLRCFTSQGALCSQSIWNIWSSLVFL